MQTSTQDGKEWRKTAAEMYVCFYIYSEQKASKASQLDRTNAVVRSAEASLFSGSDGVPLAWAGLQTACSRYR